MAMSHPEVEIPVKQAPDRSAMQARMEQVYQEKEIQPVLPKPIPVVEQPKPIAELPKPRVSPVTVEAPVVPPVVEQRVAYSQPLKQSPPAVKPVLPIEKIHEPYLQSEKEPVNWRDVGRRWKIGIGIFLVIVLILVEMWFVLS